MLHTPAFRNATCSHVRCPHYLLIFRRTAELLLGVSNARWPRFDQSAALGPRHLPSSPAQKGILMSTVTQARRTRSEEKKPAQIEAWVAKSAKQPMVQESVDLE